MYIKSSYVWVQEFHFNIVHPWQSKGSFMSTTNNASSSSNIWASSSFLWVCQTIHMIMGYINIIKVPPFSLWECVDFMTPSKHKWPQNGSFGPPSAPKPTPAVNGLQWPNYHALLAMSSTFITPLSLMAFHQWQPCSTLSAANLENNSQTTIWPLRPPRF